jgi:Fe-S-cluster-containing dehydrogenase component
MDDQSRRTFLKVLGVGVAGGVCAPVVAALARAERTAPLPGAKRYAMVVSISKCLRKEGCRLCLDACHRTHNVPDLSRPEYHISPAELPKREVKWIWKERFENVFPDENQEFLTSRLAGQMVPVLCNHCENPPCVRVCPTKATFKRPSDGVVMMDMHRCIGCRYCVVACPYGSRSFNWIDPWPRPFEGGRLAPPNPDFPTRMRGVVEKCNFCEDRRAKDENALPACVAACPEKALLFGDLLSEGSAVRGILKEQLAIRRKPGLGTNPQIYYLT